MQAQNRAPDVLRVQPAGEEVRPPDLPNEFPVKRPARACAGIQKHIVGRAGRRPPAVRRRMDAERLKERLVGQSPQQAHIVLRFAAVKLRHIDDAAVHQAGYGFRLFVNKHADGGNADGLDFVLQGTRINLLENKVALAVPEGNPKNITSYDELAAGLQDGTVFLAMGNADVPVGQYTQKIFACYGLDEEALANAGVLTYGTNVKEVTTQVSEAAVDCGIIYATDAFSAGLTVVETATAEMYGQVIYPAAVLNITRHEAEAKAFLEYLTGPEASAVFEAVGFSPISE